MYLSSLTLEQIDEVACGSWSDADEMNQGMVAIEPRRSWWSRYGEQRDRLDLEFLVHPVESQTGQSEKGPIQAESICIHAHGGEREMDASAGNRSCCGVFESAT